MTKVIHLAVHRAYVPDPPSRRIAEGLAAGAEVCEHGRNPCIMRCGLVARSARENRSIRSAGQRPATTSRRTELFERT